MIYFGLRSSRGYLELLNEVRTFSEPHDIVSVIGGLAFLQALGPNCRSLIALDSDDDAPKHARLIVGLIRASDSLQQFLSYLSAHEVLAFEPTSARFGGPIDHSVSLAVKLNDPEILNLYLATYARIELNLKSACGKIGDSTINFFGHNLAPMNFNWHFGSGVFENDESFLALREAIGSIPFELRVEGLDQFDYGAANTQRQSRLFVLASNCDSPLFNSADSILRRVQQTTLCRTQYLSWNRRLEIFPRSQVYLDLIDKLRHLCAGHALYSVGKSGVDAPRETLAGSSYTNYASWAALSEQKPYNFDTLLVWCGTSTEPNFVRDCVRYASPCFRRIIFVAAGGADELIASCGDLSASYMVEAVEWFASGVIVAWGLRGAFKGTGK